MPEEHLKKLMGDVFYGKTDFNGRAKSVLMDSLCLDVHNEFVQKYNK